MAGTYGCRTGAEEDGEAGGGHGVLFGMGGCWEKELIDCDCGIGGYSSIPSTNERTEAVMACLQIHTYSTYIHPTHTCSRFLRSP